MTCLELKVPPLLLWIIFAVAIGVVGVTVPIAPLEFAAQPWLASVFLLLGAAVVFLGVLAVKMAKTTVNPMQPDKASALVVTGIYRFTRNPIYLGMTLLLLGIALWFASSLGVLFALLFVGYLNRFQIIPEERFLQASFGDTYSDYRQRVRRWL